MNPFSTPIAMAEPLLANLPMGIHVYNGDTGDCLLANQAVAEMLGKGKPLHYEEWVTDRDGRRLLIDTLKTPYYDPDGGPLGLVGIGRDLCSAEKGPAADKADNGPVIVGNIEDDYHSLGRKLVSVFLQSAGWQVIDLGNDVTAQEFVDKAVETGARVIGVSAMMYTTAENIKRVRDELDRRNLAGNIKLAVGGAVFKFRPELVKEVGGDGTAANGFEAPRLFAELWERSLKEVSP